MLVRLSLFTFYGSLDFDLGGVIAIMEKNKSLFTQGLKEGFPIGMGYLPLAFSLGVNAATDGFKFFTSVAMSLLSFTGVGQMNAMALMLENATYFSIFISLMVINLRNIVLSLSLTQRLEENVSLWQRLIIAMGNTDEIFALTIRREGKIPADYFIGVMTFPYFAWAFGSVVGNFATTLVPKDICIVMSMALYAMLIAAVVPAAKKSRSVLFVAVLSGVLSFVMQGVKPINAALVGLMGKSASSWILVAGSVFTAAIAAYIWPVKDIKEEN